MKETDFAYRIRQALNEGAERLDYKATLRLDQARRKALAHHKAGAGRVVWTPALQVATAGGAPSSDEPSGFWAWLRGAGLVAPLVALLIGFVGIHEWQRLQSIEDLAALDFAVLLDENPIDTFAEPGFGVLLNHQSFD